MNVSVVIPTLNEAAVITRCVESAVAAGADEVLVGDGGSQDGTCELAEGCGARVVASEPGRGVQQNTAAAKSLGDILLFLHADNWLGKDAILQVRDAFGGPVTCSAFRQRINAGGVVYRALEFGNSLRVQWLGTPFGDQGICIRRDVFEELGRFPETPLMEDLLLMRAVRRRAYPRLLPGPVYVSARRWQRHGVVRQTIRNWRLLRDERRGVPLATLAERYRRHDQ